MIRLYHCADARSFRPLWALEELGLPYELHILKFPPRLRQPEYLEVNPLGTIPAMKDGDTETLIALESMTCNVAHQSEDAKEGVQSFLEKRDPVWKHR